MLRLAALLSLVATGCSEYDLNPHQEDPGRPRGDTGVVDTGTPSELPIARCDVSPNPVHPPFEKATWNGVNSFDPQGGTIQDYRWTLVHQPPGSAVTMPPGGPVRAGFAPDLAGIYTGQLVVVTSDGRQSEPCRVDLEAIPAEDLWIEMFWVHNQDDMDLHLLAPGGSIRTRKDCYFSNCVPEIQAWAPMDWGTVGDPSDNPTLDLDDIPGRGPENINIPSPQPGVYKVIVHDYTASTPDFYGANDVTVNVYFGGVLEWSDTRPISGDGDYVDFCAIDWAAGTVTPL